MFEDYNPYMHPYVFDSLMHVTSRKWWCSWSTPHIITNHPQLTRNSRCLLVRLKCRSAKLQLKAVQLQRCQHHVAVSMWTASVAPFFGRPKRW